MDYVRKCMRATTALGGVVLLVLLAACSTSSGSAGGSTGAAIGGSGAKINVRVGTITPHNMNNIAYFVQASPAYSYTVAQANAAVAEAKALGVNLSIHWDNLDPALELSGFQQAIASGKYGGII